MEKKRKVILIGLGVIAAVYAGYKILSPKKPITPTGGGGGGTTPTGGGGTTAGLDFVDLAGQLFDAFDGCFTTNSVWRKVLNKLQNQADWDALNKAYGSNREITCWISSNYKGGLQGAFRSELSESELGEANGILATKNISSL